MASWYYSTSKGKQYVKVYARNKDGIVKPLGRRVIRDLYGTSLDNLPPEALDAWCLWYEKNYETPKRNPEDRVDPKLLVYVREYVDFLDREEGRDPKTISDHRKALYESVIPFFSETEPHLHDPNEWSEKSHGFKKYLLEDRKLSEHQAIKANTALASFWRYLCRCRVVRFQTELVLWPIKRLPGTTPLKVLVSPEQILEWFGKLVGREPRVAYMGLVGYFFSLRPQETFALRACDFVGGPAAAALAVCKTNEAHGFFNKLAVYVHRQRHQNAKLSTKRAYKDKTPYPIGFKPPKAGKIAYVACFSEKAAQLLKPLFSELQLKGHLKALLFAGTNDKNFDLWDKHGYCGKAADGSSIKVTLKDLRRASLNWLGHEGGMTSIPLHEHARHEDIETTLLYCRNPETKKADDSLDLGSW